MLLIKWWREVILAVLLVVLARTVWQKDQLKIELAQQQTAHAIEKEQRANAARQQTEAAMRRTDLAEQALALARTQLNKDQESKNEQIATIGRGTPCLSQDLLTVLNGDLTPIDSLRQSTGEHLPTAVVSPAGAGTAPAETNSDPSLIGGLNERDTARWITTAQAMYQSCAAQIDALRSWYQDPK